MGIPNKNFKEALRLKFVQLLESKRGVQSKLAKAIGKPASYFSEIKRGNPVNALHLKAAGIVFGPGKVIELLDIDNDSRDGEKASEESRGATNKITKIIVEYQDLIKQFKNPERAKKANEGLFRLEEFDEQEFNEACDYIDFKVQKSNSAQKKDDLKTSSGKKKANGR